MKKAMKQSTLLKILGISVFVAIDLVALCFTCVIIINNNILENDRKREQMTSLAHQYINASSYLAEQVRAYTATGDQTYRNNYETEVNTTKRRESAFEELEKLGLSQEELDIFTSISTISNNLVPLEQKAMDYARYGQSERALEIVYSSECADSLAEMQSLQQQFLTSIQQRIDAQSAYLQNNIRFMQAATVVCVVIVVVCQVVNYHFTHSRVLNPLKKIQAEMHELSLGNLSHKTALTPDTSELGMLIYAILETKQSLKTYITDIREKLARIAEGDLSTGVTMEYIGDFSEIRTAINSITSSLSMTLSQINESASQVSIGADQVSAGSQSYSQGSTQQASAVQQLAATINDISSQIQNNAANAEQSSRQAQDVGQGLNVSNEKMNQMVQAMHEINESASQIGKIIKTIEDIAFQTNILALNAAVEAARAGVAGRGFAVVADEVRNLASKSAQASKDTSTLIEKSLQAVEKGRLLADDASHALTETAEYAYQVISAIEEISEASSAQATSVSQITLGIDQISSVIQTNSATAQQSAAASEELAGQAQLLKNLIATFHLSAQTEEAY